uniref:Monocarboxylate transporter 12-like n=1 Tax=Saccoglossus kowalevskii TaxID=10224 RepID=A0ABM0MJU8_SACKO|nr:PREDICTED: monocarboxylate transporter 12-like [Saccoglossus kowalevskii]
MSGFHGIGFAFLYGQSIIIVGKYFYRRHALANGIAYAGGAVGIMALPPLYQVLINKYGWRGAMIVMSGINMHSIVSGMLMRPPPKHDSSETLDTMNNAPIMDETCVIESKVKKEKEGTLTETNYKQCQVHQNRCDESDATERKNIGNRNPKKLRTKIVVKFGLYLFTDSWFNILCITAFLSALGHLAVMAHLISNAASYGIPKLDAAFLMTILGIGALGGRATHGWFVDLGHFSPMFVVAGAWCAAGTVVLLLLIANGNYIVYACLSVSYGFLSGIAIPLNGAVCMKACLPNETFPTAFGWFLSLLGLGNLLGPVLAGWIYDATSNYNMSFLLAGIILILTGLLIFMQIIYKRCRRKKLGMDTQEKEESLLRIPGNTITSSNSVIQKVTTV